jgi:hypothetical protein
MPEPVAVEVAPDADPRNADVDRWTARVRTQLRLLAGSWVDEAESVWTAFAGHPLVRIVIHGGYDAGKSSLLKRFLVADGTPVPDWLVVGARPTTAAVGQVDSGGITWLDTPGTSAGNAEHDELAERALALTDGLLVVLSPQLIGGGSSRLPRLLDGSFYNTASRAPLFPSGALVVAVAQMDTAGVSAEDDPEGYHELCARKRAELDAILDRIGVTLPAGSVHLVAADPDLAGLIENPAREDYTGHEDWDGVAALRAALQALASRRTELRRAAAVRYWSLLGNQAHVRAEAELRDLDALLDAARREQQATDQLLAELEALDEAARSRLHDLLRSAVQGMALPSGPHERRRDHVEQRLRDTIDAWLADRGAALERFARTADVDQQQRAERPGSAALRHYLDDLVGDVTSAPTSDPDPSLKTLLVRFTEHASTLARSAFTLTQGMTPDDARAELQRIRRPGGPSALRGGMLTGAEQADAIQRSLHRLAAVEQLVPTVLELGGYVLDHRAETRSQQRRGELHEQLRQHADRVAHHVLDSGDDIVTWSAAVASVRDAIRSRRTPQEVATTAEQRRQVIGRVSSALEELLAGAPLEPHPEMPRGQP